MTFNLTANQMNDFDIEIMLVHSDEQPVTLTKITLVN